MSYTKDVRAGTAAILLGVVMATSSCGTQQSTTDRNMEAPAQRDRTTTITPDVEIDAEDRRKDVNTLEDLRDDIDKSIARLDSRMADTGSQAKLDQLREHRLELERNRARVTDEIRNIEVAEPTTWHAVRQAASETGRDVRDWFSRQGDRVEQIFSADDAGEDSDDEQD